MCIRDPVRGRLHRNEMHHPTAVAEVEEEAPEHATEVEVEQPVAAGSIRKNRKTSHQAIKERCILDNS